VSHRSCRRCLGAGEAAGGASSAVAKAERWIVCSTAPAICTSVILKPPLHEAVRAAPHCCSVEAAVDLRISGARGKFPSVGPKSIKAL